MIESESNQKLWSEFVAGIWIFTTKSNKTNLDLPNIVKKHLKKSQKLVNSIDIKVGQNQLINQIWSILINVLIKNR